MVAALSGGCSITWVDDPGEIDATAWDALLPAEGANPFLRHAFFLALHDTGSAAPATGWHPQFLLLHDAAGRLRAACPAYAKDHSYGEYVFDWAWADAHDRALARQGTHYYPKLLGAVPFSPIPGPRLLVDPSLPQATRAAWQGRLLDALTARCEERGWSSAHLLFMQDDEASLAAERGWLKRPGVQFHWLNRAGTPYADFADFLGTLQREKRKKIQQERRKVAEAGVRFEVKHGAAITEADWDFFHRCYTRTYLEHGQRPYLAHAFWHQVGSSLPDCWTMFIAVRDGERIAASLLAVDPQARVAYGRYWGALASVSCLHFEACYYQGIEWCIEHGMQRFEGGAQGEHKLARGLLPVTTHSVHLLRHPGLRQAVAEFLDREQRGIGYYLNELEERQPFKAGDPPT